MNICDVEAFVLSNRKQNVIHEKILKQTTKLYFDIETHKDASDNLVMINLDKFK